MRAPYRRATDRTVVLTHTEAEAAVRLLRLLRTLLKSSIESTLLPGEKNPSDETDKAYVLQDRADSRAAAQLIIRLSQ